MLLLIQFFEKLNPIGSEDPFTVLNVLGADTAKSYFMADSLNTGSVSMDYYKEHELTIGAQINIFGRKVVITDLDAFTKEYYRSKFIREISKHVNRIDQLCV